MAGQDYFVPLVNALQNLLINLESLESPSPEDRDEFDENNRTAILHDVKQCSFHVGFRPPDPSTRLAVGELLKEIREMYGLNSPPPSPVEPPPQRIVDKLREIIDSDSLKGHQAKGGIGFLGGTKLCDALGVHDTQKAAFMQKLGRNRKGLGDDNWEEVQNRGPNAPQFLYLADSKQIRDLAAAYLQRKSG